MDSPKVQSWLQEARQLLKDWDTPNMVTLRAGKQDLQLYQVLHSLTGERIIVEADSADKARIRAGLAVGLSPQQAKREMIAYRLAKAE